ncbi:serine/threonine-protein kinase ulk4 [Plakobranchus ocellatus]|uniref:Serine/threonine-protein kinase ulk4 n=1 Tax=Plakobranchus ocellatus TaxID=259542 RepID=A0AAV4CLX6_9GAST|nr:serine/threonine-protein kinase ulk4 [Plakobranchus ocellatus]
MLCEPFKRVQLDKLSLIFLQKEHTENENDSVHGVTEKATKTAAIYSPEQRYAAVKTARKSMAPYHTEAITHSQFANYKTISQLVKNLNIDVEGNKVQWSNAREFTVYGNDAQALYITYEYCGTRTTG